MTLEPKNVLGLTDGLQLDVTEELDLGISTPLTKVAAVTIDRHFARARKADMKLCVGHVFKKYGI